MTEPYLLTATDGLKLMRTGALTVEAYVTSLITRIQAREPTVKAWAYFNRDHVLAQARALDQLPPSERGPLHGLPIGIKDIILTKDLPTSYNSPIFAHPPPSTTDAPCILTLRSLGALLLGKTTTTEFATTTVGPPTTNPHNPSHTPGGSSSGSAAAVADFHVPLALGTQTGGSIIRPAAYTGVYGFKPTWGVVGREGVGQHAITCDTVGFFARTVADLEVLARVYRIVDDEPVPEEPLRLGGARIAFCKSPAWNRAEEGTRDAFVKARELLSAHGTEVVDLDLPSEFSQVGEWAKIIQASEGQSSFLGYYNVAKEKLDPMIRGQVENERGISRAEVRRAYDGCAALRPVWDCLAGVYDAVVLPCVVGEAPEGLGYTGDAVFCAMWTVLHAPMLNVPGFVGKGGLPVGLMVVGGRYRDSHVLRAGKAIGKVFEAEGGWKHKLF